MRYGRINETNQTANEYRVGLILNSVSAIQLGNGGLNKPMIHFLNRNKADIEDIFLDNDSLYILPKTKEFATLLFNTCVGEKVQGEDEYLSPIADEIDWLKLGDRYYLRLWWD